MKKIEYILKHNGFILWLYRTICGCFFRVIGIFIPTDENLILFTGHGKKYNDSPRKIYEFIVKNQSTFSHLKCVWAISDENYSDVPNCKIIKPDSLEYFKTALSAKYWVACVNIERGMRFKKKKTIYLNTWHGASINKMGNAVQSRNDFNWSHINYFCYSGEYEKHILERDFQIKSESLIPTGLPRNDELYKIDSEEIKLLKQKLNIPTNKKIILYAPTWRDSADFGTSYMLTPPINWRLWEEKLNDKYIVLLRTHNYTTQLMGVNFNKFVYDMSSYPVVNDLLKISDILISDYSSIILDYAILERPIFCFGYDYFEYSKIRGFYFDLQTVLPNGVIDNEKKLLNEILKIDFNKQKNETRKLKEDRLNFGGSATYKCINYLFRENNN